MRSFPLTYRAVGTTVVTLLEGRTARYELECAPFLQSRAVGTTVLTLLEGRTARY